MSKEIFRSCDTILVQYFHYRQKVINVVSVRQIRVMHLARNRDARYTHEILLVKAVD